MYWIASTLWLLEMCLNCDIFFNEKKGVSTMKYAGPEASRKVKDFWQLCTTDIVVALENARRWSIDLDKCIRRIKSVWGWANGELHPNIPRAKKWFTCVCDVSICKNT
jgi:hypothetical protein